MILASKEQIKHYGDVGCWGTRTLLDDFRQNALANPGHTALVDPLNKEALMGLAPERVSYAELNRAVDGVASALLAEGIGKDDVVIVQLPNCWELAMLYLAVAKVGAISSPIPMQWRAKELAYVAELTEAKVFITLDSFHGFAHLTMGKEVQKQRPSLKSLFSFSDIRTMLDHGIDSDLAKVPVDANDIFTICWTSGTEAQSKGCPLSHNNYRCQAEMVIGGGVNRGDTLLTAGPMVNMGAIGTAYIPWLLTGGTLVLHHPFDPQLLLKQLVDEKVNFTLLVPAVLNLILKHPATDSFDLSSINNITVGSAPPSLWSMQEFKRRWGIDIGNIWGQNEGTGIVSVVADVPDMELRVDHFPRYGVEGKQWAAPITEFMQTKIVDDDGVEITGEGAVGELLYRGPNVLSGYYRRPDLNEKAFYANDYLHTGDLYQIMSDEHFRFVDRKKDIIIRGGLNISAQEVENMIQAHPAIQDVAAVGMPDEVLGERTCVYVVPKAGETVTLDSVVTFMKEQDAAVYKLPERLETVAEIPRNPVGKVLKRELREVLLQKIAVENKEQCACSTVLEGKAKE